MATPRETHWWEAIAKRDFQGWSGLPPGLSYAQVAIRFTPAHEGEGTGLLGARPVRTSFGVYSAEGYPHPLRVWFMNDRVVLIDIKLPDLAATSTQDLLGDLGEPAAKLHHAFGVLRVPAGLRVYPERGVAVFVGPEGQVLELQLFPPTDLSDYQERLQPSSELVEPP